MFDVVGYAEIKKDAKITSPINSNFFQGKICRVMEFAFDGGILVIDQQSQGLAMIEKEDIHRSFKCELQGDIICPPNLDYMDKVAYYVKCMSRKGGYNNFLKQMVIQCSLMKGEFTDNILWAK